MWFSACLAFLLFLFLSYGRIPFPAGLLFSLLGGGLLAIAGKRRQQTGPSSIDVLAQRSPLRRVNAKLRLFSCVAALFLCIAANSILVGIVTLSLCIGFLCTVGKLRPSSFLRVFALPLSFLLLGSFALLLQVSSHPQGLFDLPFLGRWLSVTPQSQLQTVLVLAKSLGAASCTYALALTTPMAELLEAMRELHVPSLLIELMFLLYRYIFLLFSMLVNLTHAAKSRLGYHSLRAGLRSAGGLAANLLVLSLRRASASYDAMQARCYQGTLSFFYEKPPVRTKHVVYAGAILLLQIAVIAIQKKEGWP